MNKNKYNFIGTIALEYRLSLSNVCKILGKKPTEELKMELYNLIIESTDSISKKNAYKFLFNYETVTEKEEVSNLTYQNAYNFLNSYCSAAKSKNKEELTKLKNEITKLSKDFETILRRDPKTKLTDQDYLTISKYRLKHAISLTTIASALNMRKDTISSKESNFQDSILKHKLELLNDYHAALYVTGKRYK